MFGSWNIFVGMYLFLGGTGAGAFLYSLYLERKGIDALKGYVIAPILVLIGSLLLIFDLSPEVWLKPWKLLPLLSNPTSVMTWGTYILVIFIIISSVKAFIYCKKCNACCLFLDIIGAVFAVATMGYTGILLMAVDAVPFWNSIFIPILFMLSSVSCGVAAVKLTGTGCSCKCENIVTVAEFVILSVFILFALNGGLGEVGQVSASMLLSGSLVMLFWIMLILLGFIVPITLGVSGRMPMLANICKLIGGEALRFCILLAAVPII